MQPPILTRPFLLLVAGHFLESLGYASLLLLPLYLDHLGASRAQVGTVLAAGAIGGLAVRPAVAWSLDRLGRRISLLGGTGLLAVGLVATGLADRVGPWVYGAQILAGMGVATTFTGYFTAAADLVPPQRRTEGLALFGISGLVPLGVNPLAVALGFTGAELPRFFLAVGGLVALSGAFLFSVPGGRVTGVAPRLAEIGAALRARVLWSVWLATATFSTLVATTMAFATVVAADRGMANPSLLWLTYAAGAVGVRLFGASVPDRVGPARMIPPAMSTYIGAVGIVAGAHTSGGFLLAGGLAGIGHGYAFPVLTGQVVDRVTPGLRGTAMSLYTALWDVVKLAWVPVAGILADGVGDTAMLLTTATAAACSLAIWGILEGRGSAPA